MNLENSLKEIQTKLDFLMDHIHLQVDDKVVSVMDLWREENTPTQKQTKLNHPVGKELDNLIDTAFKTGDYKIVHEHMIVQKGSALYEIPLRLVHERNNRK